MKSYVSMLAMFLLMGLPGAHAGFKDQYMKMGACEDVRTLDRRCVLQESDCNPTHLNGQKNPEGEKFLNNNVLHMQNKISFCDCPRTPAYVCLTPQEGNSSEKTRTCVAHESLCDTNNGAILQKSKDPSECGCQLMRETEDSEYVPTQYGACQQKSNPKNYFCAVSPTHCESPYTWVAPADTNKVLGHQCTCELVHTGGCVGGFSSIFSKNQCAITSDDCPGGDSFFKPVTLKQKHGESCRLCEPSDATRVLFRDAIDSTKQEFPIWGIVAIAACVLTLLIIVFRCARRFCNRNKEITKNAVATIEAAEETSGDDDDGENIPAANKDLV